MRLTQIKRSFTFAAVIVMIFVAAAIPALGFTIESPTEGQSVRGQVPIIIPRSSLPSDVASSGFLAIKINGQFCAAVSATDQNSDEKKPASPSIVFMWDSKQPIGDVARGDAKTFPDGDYDVVIEAHSMQAGSKDTIVASAKVKISLKNEIPQSNPPAPIDMRYRYLLGQTTSYRFKTEGEVFDKYNFSMSGGMPPIMGEFTVIQAIEDPRRDGTALVRYKVDKDSTPFCQIPGQPITMLAITQKFHSIYRVIDNAAKVLEANVFTLKNAGDVADCLVALPGTDAKVNASWPSTYHLKLEGISEAADLTGQSTLEALEWEDGIECAKITSNLSGTMLFPFMQASPVPVQCKSTAYFAYKLHKLIKNTMQIEFSTNLDSSIVSKLQAPISQSGGSSGSSTPAAPSASAMPPPGMYGPLAGSYTMSAPPSMGSSSSDSSGGLPVKVRFTVVEELVRK